MHYVSIILDTLLYPQIYLDIAETLLRLAINRSIEIGLDKAILDFKCQLWCVAI